MTLMQVAHLECDRTIDIDDREIGVHPRRDPSFAPHAEATRRLRSHKRTDALERQGAVVMTAFEEHGERRLHTSDTTPGRGEIAALHGRRRRRVVGRHDVDASARELVPEPALIVRRPQRRGTLGK